MNMRKGNNEASLEFKTLPSNVDDNLLGLNDNLNGSIDGLKNTQWRFFGLEPGLDIHPLKDWDQNYPRPDE